MTNGNIKLKSKRWNNQTEVLHYHKKLEQTGEPVSEQVLSTKQELLKSGKKMSGSLRFVVASVRLAFVCSLLLFHFESLNLLFVIFFFWHSWLYVACKFPLAAFKYCINTFLS